MFQRSGWKVPETCIGILESTVADVCTANIKSTASEAQLTQLQCVCEVTTPLSF
jgi:hypothetical protein